MADIKFGAHVYVGLSDYLCKNYTVKFDLLGPLYFYEYNNSTCWIDSPAVHWCSRVGRWRGRWRGRRQYSVDRTIGRQQATIMLSKKHCASSALMEVDAGARPRPINELTERHSCRGADCSMSTFRPSSGDVDSNFSYLGMVENV